MLSKVSHRLSKGDLRKSEAKIADVVVADPQRIVNLSIASLASEASVSEPSVNRFCKAMGCTGFPDFKIQLAQSIAQGISFVGNNVSPEDSTESLISKIFDASITTIKTTKESLDARDIDRAIDVLAQAKKVEFHGLGASGSVAMDAQHKFFRLNIPVTAQVDILMQRMSAAAMNIGDVLVLISNTGRTSALIEVATLAKSAGATVIGLTTPKSPLAEQCNIVLEVDPQDDTVNYTPTTSRLAHLVILDVLATGVALKRGPNFTEHLRRVKDALIETRL